MYVFTLFIQIVLLKYVFLFVFVSQNHTSAIDEIHKEAAVAELDHEVCDQIANKMLEEHIS